MGQVGVPVLPVGEVGQEKGDDGTVPISQCLLFLTSAPPDPAPLALV